MVSGATGDDAPAPIEDIRVSVIIPVFNDAAHLPHAIASVLDQVPPVVELVIVDDGSTDGSAEIADRACADPRVRVIHQANAGPGAAANAGLASITGTHVLLVDSDDWLEVEALATLIPMARQWDPDVVSFGARVVDEHGQAIAADGRQAHSHYAKPDLTPAISGVDYYQRVQSTGWVTASSKTYLWRYAYLKEIRLRVPETYIYEDEYFTPIAVLCAASIVSTSRALYVRMNRPDSLTMRPLSAFNTEQRIDSAALLRDAAEAVASAAGTDARRLIIDRSRRLARAALVESERIGNEREAIVMLRARLGIGPDALGLVGWLMTLRIRLTAGSSRLRSIARSRLSSRGRGEKR